MSDFDDGGRALRSGFDVVILAESGPASQSSVRAGGHARTYGRVRIGQTAR